MSTHYDGRQLIAFVRDGRPVFHIEMARCWPDFVGEGALTRGVKRDDARFTLRPAHGCLVATLDGGED